jgi:lysophospholipase L1-like esterase
VRWLRLIPHGLFLLTVATLLLMFKEWAYVATYRLYLDRRVDDAVGSTAKQRFDLEQSGVVPRIVTHDERVSFRAAIGQDATIRADLQPADVAGYEIHLRQGGADTLVARETITRPTSIVYPVPTGNGTVDIVSRGELTWSDLRLQRNLRLAPELWLLGMLLACAMTWQRGQTRQWFGPAVVHGSRARVLWMATLTIFASVAMGLLVLEAGLRAFAGQLPSGISALRHDLGEPTEDERWVSSPRYGRRLRANVRAAENEWRDGDIIRMGFVPPAMSEGRMHRYRFHTDGEGFRNPVTRETIDVAALGDSFTDALTMAVEASWPAQLERQLGLAVQNYGTAGFGPQQERMVLEDYALAHHPRIVVLAFFAGNDIREAERFEEFEHGDQTIVQSSLGWQIKDVVVRAEGWYVTSALQAAALAFTPNAAAQASAPEVSRSLPPTVPAEGPRFDRGLFTVPSGDRVLRFALMPPYLNLLNFSEGDLAARRGWALILDNIRRMQRASNEAGARFVLMFVPFKSQVYLPLLERSFTRESLSDALHFFLPDMKTRPDLQRFSRNRLAQNALMQRFCEQEGIPFLDLTPSLQQRVEDGENMYFPDDSHFNEAGEALAASTLATFLETERLLGPKR